jgi:hypothetical protein
MKIKVTGKWVEVTELGKHHFPGLLTALSNFDVRIGIDQLSVCCETQTKIVDFLVAYCKIKDWSYEIEEETNYDECAKELMLVLKKHKLNLHPKENHDSSLGLVLSPNDTWLKGKYLCTFLKGNE